MAIIRKEHYSTAKVDALYNMLKELESKGCAKEYKIKVDGLEAVGRTSSTEHFYIYQNLVHEDVTGNVEVVIFQGKSQHCDRHIFLLNDWEKEQAFSPLEVQRIVRERVQEQEKLIHEQIQKKIEEEKKLYYVKNLEEENVRLHTEKENLQKLTDQQHKVIELLEQKLDHSESGMSMQNTIAQIADSFLGKGSGLLPAITPAKPETIIHAVPENEQDFILYLRKEFAKTTLGEGDLQDLLFTYRLRSTFGEDVGRICNLLDDLKNNREHLDLIESLLQ